MLRLKIYCLLLLGLFACTKANTDENSVICPPVISGYLTKNIVILVIDGARYSETFGDSLGKYIPGLKNVVAPKACLNTSFKNTGYTETMEGHVAMITSNDEYSGGIGGTFPPTKPSFFNLWLKAFGNQKEKAWLISSKDKLEILTRTTYQNWDSLYSPSTFCGTMGQGQGSGYGSDSVTYHKTMEVLKTKKPKLLMVSFMEPDVSAHNEDWDGYLKGLVQSDNYVTNIWKYLQQDPHYQNNTTIFITNDHGRHTDDNGGFGQHGDSCSGCRRIFLLASGPDFKTGVIFRTQRNLKDISPTIATLLDFEMPTATGNPMLELLKEVKH